MKLTRSWKQQLKRYTEEIRYGKWLYRHRTFPDNSIWYGFEIFAFIALEGIPKRDLKHKPQWARLEAIKAEKEYNNPYAGVM